MSYTPTDWQIGDVITAEKLNKMEQGIAGGSNDVFTFVATMSNDLASYTFDHTLKEIMDANIVANKTIVCIVRFGTYAYNSIVFHGNDSITVQPIVDQFEYYSMPKVFTIARTGDSDDYYIESGLSNYIIPLASNMQDRYVPMVGTGIDVDFDSINFKVDFDNTLESLLLAAMQMTDVAAVFTDSDTVSASFYVTDSAIRELQAGRGVIGYHTMNDGSTTYAMTMTGYTGDGHNQVVYSNIDVCSTTDTDGVYDSVTTGHGTITLAVKLDENGDPTSALVAIHLDMHTPSIV